MQLQRGAVCNTTVNRDSWREASRKILQRITGSYLLSSLASESYICLGIFYRERYVTEKFS